MPDLIVVESPNKAKHIKEDFHSLKNYMVKATFGHIKDLKTGNGELGVDINTLNATFVPKDLNSKRTLDDIKRMAAGNTVYIATDPDREGYAIGYHVYETIKSVAKEIKRAEFREITESHIKQELQKAVPFNKTNNGLYQAFLGRRISDRLVGFMMSPDACKALNGRFSVGRVQSPSLRLVVDREREIKNFKPQAYYVVSIDCEKNGQVFNAVYKKGNFDNKADAERIAQKVYQVRSAIVKSIEEKDTFQSPFAPFTTSTLQQTANSQLGFSPEVTMSLAQVLFEEGKITYHRTDSVRLSPEFTNDARNYIQKQFGANYLPQQAVAYKSKNSQADAHEAIRPSVMSPAINLTGKLTGDHRALYELIFKRTIACQMKPAVYKKTTVLLDCAGEEFIATGRVPKFDGYLKAYSHQEDKDKETEQALPAMVARDNLKKHAEFCEERFTKPPARFTEGSLVRELERLGIGRPSTYASIINVLKGSYYKGKPSRTPYMLLDKGKLVPTPSGNILADYLKNTSAWVLDYELTRRMEDSLDEVENNGADYRDYIRKEILNNINSSSGASSQYKSQNPLPQHTQNNGNVSYGNRGGGGWKPYNKKNYSKNSYKKGHTKYER
ncbi:MAG: DNA topoisomerase 1 [Syntrophomonadaceae bacterium]|nr:DNA topoisomerase 1 [Bacillota bacterium]